MDYSKLIAAILAAQAAHTGGHFNSSSDNGIEASLHGQAEEYNNPVVVEKTEPYFTSTSSTDKTGGVHYDYKLINKKKLALENSPLTGPKAVNIHGGGFSMADEVGRASNDPYYNAGNALVKLFHLIGGPEGMSRDIRRNSGGDLAAMKKESGNKHVPEMVAASAIFDAMKARGMDKDGSLSFTTLDQGVPALVYSRRF